MSLVRVLIVEDELLVAEDMKQQLNNYGYTPVGVAANYTEAMKLLKETKPDIAIVDITLAGQKTGVDLAEHIRHLFNIPFIFATSHADKLTVEKAKSVRPNGYLLKPFEASDLYTSIEMALAAFQPSNTEQAEKPDSPDAIFVKSDDHFIRLFESDIIWAKSEQNYLIINTTQEKHLIRSSFPAFTGQLKSGKFLRVHKSYLVNIYKVTSVNSSSLSVEGDEIPVGRSYREILLKKLNAE